MTQDSVTTAYNLIRTPSHSEGRIALAAKLAASIRDEMGLPPLHSEGALASPVEYVSQYVPDGWDTWVSFVAKHRPEWVMMSPSEVAEDTCRDGFWLKRRADDYLTVPAPAPFKAIGIERVNAYRVGLLHQRMNLLESRGL